MYPARAVHLDRWSSRPLRFVSLLLVPLIVLVAFLMPRAAWADGTTISRFIWSSSSGDFAAGGTSGSIDSSSATFDMHWTAADLQISVIHDTQAWTVELAAPNGRQLQPGSYDLAVLPVKRTGSSPGLSVTGGGSTGGGCNNTYGSFTIRSIQTDASDAVTSLDASFIQHCGASTAPPLVGVIQYNVSADSPVPALPVPPAETPTDTSIVYAGQKDDPAGGNYGGRFDPSNSTIALNGDVHGFRIDVVPRVATGAPTPAIIFNPPPGQDLHPGTYLTAVDTRTMQPGQAADLREMGFVGCGNSYGSFTITSMHTDVYGQIDSLDAHFIMHCVSSTGRAGWATIHYRVDPATASPTWSPDPEPVTPSWRSSFIYASAPGAPVVVSPSGSYDLANASFSIQGDPHEFGFVVTHGTDRWTLDFRAPAGSAFHTGTYTSVIPVGTSPADQSTIDFGYGQGTAGFEACVGAQARFTIDQMHVDVYGLVDSAEVEFYIQCRSRITHELEPPIAGVIRFRVTSRVASDTVSVPPTPVRTTLIGSLLVPSDIFSTSGLTLQEQVAREDNTAADSTPFYSAHGHSYGDMQRIGGTFQHASGTDGSEMFVLGSAYDSPSNAIAAWTDAKATLGATTPQAASDCSRRASTRCTIFPLTISRDLLSRQAIVQYNDCTMELLFRAPRGGAQSIVGSGDTPLAVVYLLASAGETIQHACSYSSAPAAHYAFSIHSAHLVSCTGSATHCGGAPRTIRVGSTIRLTVPVSVKRQPRSGLYAIADAIQPPSGRALTYRRVASALKNGTTLTGSQIHITRAGRWVFTLRITSADGQSRRTSVTVRAST